MYPQQRNEMYEYPLENLSYEQLLQRRFNHWRDVLLFRLQELEAFRKIRAENPSYAERNQQTGQPVSITQMIAEAAAFAKMARNRVDIIDKMLADAKDGRLDEHWSDEALAAPIDLGVPSPIPPEPPGGDYKPKKH